MSTTGSEGLERLDIDDPAAGLLAYSIGGKVTTEQAKEVFDRVEQAAASGRKLRLYYEMHGFPTAEPGVFIAKLKHLRAIFKTFERLAIVGDQRWLGTYTAIFDPITKMDIRHFPVERREEAIAWIRE